MMFGAFLSHVFFPAGSKVMVGGCNYVSRKPFDSLAHPPLAPVLSRRPRTGSACVCFGFVGRGESRRLSKSCAAWACDPETRDGGHRARGPPVAREAPLAGARHLVA